MPYLNRTVGQLAVEITGATAIFFQHKINFCCDGDKKLSQAIAAKSLDESSITNALEQLSLRQQIPPNLEELSNQEIIDYVLNRFHEVHREQLPELIRLAKRVELVHKNHPLCPKGLAEHLTNMQAELAQHMQKEEDILFPLLAKSRSTMVAGPISVMKHEHQEHLTQINTIYKLTNDVIPQQDACNTWQALYVGLQQFISDLNQHIHTENNLLFNRAVA